MDGVILGQSKGTFRVFCYILWKNPNELFGQSNTMDAEAETPILWPPDVKNWLIDPDAGKDWRQEKGMIKDKMAGWHHQLDEHEFEQAPSGSWWWTGKPGVLQSMGSQTVRHKWETKLNWILWNTKMKMKSIQLGKKFSYFLFKLQCDLWNVTMWVVKKKNQVFGML